MKNSHYVAPPPAPPCVNTNGAATDPYGDGCDAYTTNPGWCGGYNSAKFNSYTMCCICGGGSTFPTSRMLSANASMLSALDETFGTQSNDNVKGSKKPPIFAKTPLEMSASEKKVAKDHELDKVKHRTAKKSSAQYTLQAGSIN